MNALKDKNRPDSTKQTRVNPHTQSFAVEEDPEFQLRELMREHTEKLTDLHEVSLAKARDDARTVFDAALETHKTAIAEAVKAAASSEDVTKKLSLFHTALSAITEKVEELSGTVADTGKDIQRTALHTLIQRWVTFAICIGSVAVNLLLYIAFGVRLA